MMGVPRRAADDPEITESRRAGSAARAGTSYSRDSGFARAAKADPRQRRLGELMAAAADLDEDRLELLLQHARLLGRGSRDPH
jgi:hypothetical protein